MCIHQVRVRVRIRIRVSVSRRLVERWSRRWFNMYIPLSFFTITECLRSVKSWSTLTTLAGD